MVLSNKKLKQKARATLAGSLIASVDRGHPLDPDCGDPSSQTRSLKQLLDSATQKPRLSKREKRRKALGSSGSPETAVGGIARDEEEEEKKEAGSGVEKIDEKRKKEKKKKRKRGGDGADNEIESGATPGEKDSAKKVKKKKKKKKSNKSKAENGEQHPGSETGNGGIEEQEVVQAASISHSQENGDVSTKVYVGGIPFYSTEDDIRSFFESCGTITEVDCMMFPESGKFRGISILSFKTEAAAKRALALDGADMGGLYLKIQPYRATRPGKVSDFAPEKVEGYNRVYVGNLSWDITADDLKKFFSSCSISSIRFGMDKETEEFRGYAHVDFSDSLSLTMALKLDQQILCGRPAKVSCAVPKKRTDAHPKPAQASEKADGGQTSSGMGKKKRRTCYECGVAGHLSSACPKKQASEAS